jgi:hypothetical protein
MAVTQVKLTPSIDGWSAHYADKTPEAALQGLRELREKQLREWEERANARRLGIFPLQSKWLVNSIIVAAVVIFATVVSPIFRASSKQGNHTSNVMYLHRSLK